MSGGKGETLPDYHARFYNGAPNGLFVEDRRDGTTPSETFSLRVYVEILAQRAQTSEVYYEDFIDTATSCSDCTSPHDYWEVNVLCSSSDRHRSKFPVDFGTRRSPPVLTEAMRQPD
jgi:hypothetical protein